jgi:uncharacterized protein
MPTHSQALLGRPIWYELMTTDTAAAARFYNSVVGWTAVPMHGGPMPYTIFNRQGDKGTAGMMEKPADMPMPPFWAMYIGVPQFDAAAAHIKKLGGGELSPVIDIPDIGKMQMMRDPQGAAFYIMEPARPEGPPQTAPELGEGSWLELMTTDAPAAMQFYKEVFGWQPGEAMDMGEMGTYQMFNRAHGPIGGMMNKPPQMADVPPNWGIYFLVPDVDAAAGRITAGGGKILNGPMEVPGGDRIVNAMDPQGAAFSLHSKKA